MEAGRVVIRVLVTLLGDDQGQGRAMTALASAEARTALLQMLWGMATSTHAILQVRALCKRACMRVHV